MSGTTSQANAYAVGFGPSRKVVLWSTMVDGRFSDAEVRVVLAHEIGHHSSTTSRRALAWFALFALPGAWILMRVTRRRGGMGEAAAVPLALLVVAVIQLALAPAQSWISRRMEAEADWKALQTTRDPAAARGLFVGFAETVARRPGPAGLGARPARQPPDAGAARRDGGGLAAREAVAASPRARARVGRAAEAAPAPTVACTCPTSTCTRARSRPRAASAGRRGR